MTDTASEIEAVANQIRALIAEVRTRLDQIEHSTEDLQLIAEKTKTESRQSLEDGWKEFAGSSGLPLTVVPHSRKAHSKNKR